MLQLLSNRHYVDRLLFHIESLYGSVDLLITWFVECLRAYGFRDYRESILINHKGSKDGFLYLGGLRLQVPIARVNGCLRLLPRSCILVIVWHFRFLFLQS